MAFPVFEGARGGICGRAPFCCSFFPPFPPVFRRFFTFPAPGNFPPIFARIL